MLKSKSLAALAITGLLVSTMAGYAQTNPDPHHQQGAGSAEQAPSAQDQQGMSMPMMMNMMAGMMKMMSGGQMGMGGMDKFGIGMSERVEGRIAFLRAELQITEAQSKVWDALAEALRSSAKRMKDVKAPMMAAASAPGALAQLESQESMLTARLEGVRAMKTALAPLYEALTAEQRKTADELLAIHMGLMPPGMMQGGMMPMQQ